MDYLEKVYENGLKALYGSIWGDCVGSYYEFTAASKIKIIPYDVMIKSLNVFKLPFGYFTDDTSMTWAAMDSFVKNQGHFNTNTHMRSLGDFYHNGKYTPGGVCFDIGSTVLNSIDRYEGTYTNVWPSDGNGFMMRQLPFVLHSLLNVKPEDKRNFYHKACGMTHQSEQCKAMAVVSGLQLEDFLVGKFDVRSNVACDKSMNSSGYVFGSFNIVNEVLEQNVCLESGINKCIKYGLDTDTNAAIYGMYSGIRDGVESIDIDKVKYIDEITKSYKDFFTCIAKSSINY